MIFFFVNMICNHNFLRHKETNVLGIQYSSLHQVFISKDYAVNISHGQITGLRVRDTRR